MTSKRTNARTPWDRSCCAPSMTCHPEKLDQVEVMGSERIQLRCNRGRRGQIHVAELAADHETGLG